KLSTLFFNRLSHGYEMTEAGQTVLERAADIEKDILELERELQSKDKCLKGTIRLTAPEGLTNFLLMPHIASFYQKHPEIQVELIISAEDLLLSQHQADLAIRTTKKPPPTSIGKKVCDFNIGIYANESYLKKVDDLDFPQYDYLQIDNGVNWFPPPYWTPAAPPNIVFKCGSVSSITRAANEGIGAAILPCFIGEQEPLLKRAAPVFKGVSELWVLTHADLRETARVKALREHLFKCLSEEKELIEGSAD
ncbi:MAG: LysR family transcriptional regulator, partial [Gammaproteobacteria bacterium]|nr:LysR family transcriptional regulator [Gammaproteobacteria bacterium]